MESIIELIRDHAGRVQRWSSGDGAALAAAGMHGTEAQFRRVRATRSSPYRPRSSATADEPGLLDLAVSALRLSAAGRILQLVLARWRVSARLGSRPPPEDEV